MKTMKILPLLGCLYMLTTASTCSSDDDSPVQYVPAPNPTAAVSQAVSQGNWRITYYFDTDSEETDHFTGYAFSFNANNALVATNGSNTVTGSWSVTNSNSNDDNPGNDLDFNIAFAAPANFADLSDDWDIVSYTATKIELIDVSGGNGGTDHLVFEKN